MNKQQLAAKIWESANKMRSKIEANEYKDYILGFIFYKFLSETELKFLKENDFDEDNIKALDESDEETVSFIRTNVGYFISYDSLFSTWLEKGKDFTVDDVYTSLSAFNRSINPAHKKVFEGIFETLETGLSKLGDSAASQTKAIRNLLDTIKDIPMDGRQDYDTLGFIYEYLLEKFASNAGKKAGEFYTPHEVSLLISEIVANYLGKKDQISVYDPTSGSGSLLINIGKAVARHVGSSDGIKYYAQELKENTYNLTRMNLVMRGIKPSNITTRNGDTLEEDWPYFDESDPQGTYNPLYVDAVVSNPPYSQQWDPTDKEVDPRYSYGIAPKSKADYAFLLHDLFHLKPEGIMCIILPHGVLFRGGEEGQIRKNLIENRHIQAIIGLPANIFFGTGIPTIIMVLRQKRTESDVLFIDASKGFVKEGKSNKLRACDIQKISDTVAGNVEREKYSSLVTLDEIRKNDYNLNIPRYVDSSEPAESWDIYASMFGGVPSVELDNLNAYWNALPGVREAMFSEDGSGYASLKVEDIKQSVMSHPATERFLTDFDVAFDGFAEYLDIELVGNAESVQEPVIQKEITQEIFKRTKDISLVDPYAAYQKLADRWNVVSGDLELIQTEGVASIKAVDPNMVLKKKGGKDVEVQDGWQGRILPFELVQEHLLSEDLNDIQVIDRRLNALPSLMEELVENLSEDDKETLDGQLNDDQTAFVSSALKQKIKELKKEKDEQSERLLEVLKQAEEYFTEEKALKKQLKTVQAELQEKTKRTIESLSDSEALRMLRLKWVNPLCADLRALAIEKPNELVSELEKLTKKYETTYSQICSEITSAEQELADMIDNLVGSEFDMAGLREFQSLLRGE